MATIVRHAFDTTGAPLSGRSPSWYTCINAETGEPITGPTITPIGGGAYEANVPDNVCGTWDFGEDEGLLNRYATVEARTVFTFPMFSDATGEPLTGYEGEPVFALYTNAAGTPLTPPSISELIHGWYRTSSKPTAANVVLDLTADAKPRYLVVDTDNTDGVIETDPPTISVISPPVGATVAKHQPIKVRVTDAGGLRRVILYATYSNQIAAEVVHNGENFLRPYRESSRANVTGGYEFEVRRSGGWSGSPSLFVIAYDLAGNETH